MSAMHFRRTCGRCGHLPCGDPEPDEEVGREIPSVSGDSARLTNRPDAAREANAVALERKVRFLNSPDAYPHHPPEVLVKETHMSWVFLAGDRVFKLKKPVRYPHLDQPGR